MKISHKPGSFGLATISGRLDYPYSMSFEWGGETFVVHRNLFDGYAWMTSHRDTGRKIDYSQAATAKESIQLAIKKLEARGEGSLKDAILEAKVQETGGKY